jgi:hypothetical protein
MAFCDGRKPVTGVTGFDVDGGPPADLASFASSSRRQT